jgi:hypothetical protein
MDLQGIAERGRALPVDPQNSIPLKVPGACNIVPLFQHLSLSS